MCVQCVCEQTFCFISSWRSRSLTSTSSDLRTCVLITSAFLSLFFAMFASSALFHTSPNCFCRLFNASDAKAHYELCNFNEAPMKRGAHFYSILFLLPATSSICDRCNWEKKKKSIVLWKKCVRIVRGSCERDAGEWIVEHSSAWKCHLICSCCFSCNEKKT